MLKILSLTLPSVMVFSTSLSAQGRQYSQDIVDEAEAAPGDPKPADETEVSPGEPKPADETIDDKINEVEMEDSESQDSNMSFITRQTRSKSVEVFVDYNTFLGNKEYFTPVAYGVKGYMFHTSDIKFGLSLAGEKIYFGFDRKFSDPATGRLRFENVTREGSAFRYAAHGQYFASDTTNVSLSVFGASGVMNQSKTFARDYYSRTGLSIALGNQWSWKDYTVSLNWLTISYNTSLKVGGENILERFPSNRNGGMILLSGLSFGQEW